MVDFGELLRGMKDILVGLNREAHRLEGHDLGDGGQTSEVDE